MKIQLLIISLLFMTNGLCARGLDKAFQLLPQPQSVELLPGKGIMYTDIGGKTKSTTSYLMGETA